MDLEPQLRGFLKKGWNGNGARMLTIATWIAKEKKYIVKQKIIDKDILLMTFLHILAYIFVRTPVPFLVITATTTLYIFKKLLTKIPLEELLEKLDRDTQKKLVLRMMNFCEARNIDPESADGVTKIIQDEEIKTGMVFIVLAFVHEDTKYYIL